MDTETAARILDANRLVHAEEAPHYDRLHQELYNPLEQRRIEREIQLTLDALDNEHDALPHPVRVLDIGAGTGYLTLKYAARGAHVRAVDMSPEMLAVLHAKLTQRGITNDTVSCIIASFDDFLAAHGPEIFPEHIITLSSVLHHLPDPEDAVRNLCERMRPGAVLLVTHEPFRLTHPEGVWQRVGRRVLWFCSRVHDHVRRRRWRVRRLDVPLCDYHWADYHAYEGLDMDALIGCADTTGCRVQYHATYATPAPTMFLTALARYVFRLRGGGSFIVVKKH